MPIIITPQTSTPLPSNGYSQYWISNVVNPQTNTEEIVEAEIVDEIIEPESVDEPEVIEPGSIDTNNRSQRWVTFYRAALLLLGSILVFDVTRTLLTIKGSAPYYPIQAQGFERNSLTPEGLKKREEAYQSLKTTHNTVTSISKHFAALSNYAKPAVVYVYPGPDDDTRFGSGFIYTSDGIIITNAHVVDGAKDNTIAVRFFDGIKSTGNILGVDPKTDLAVLKVNKNDLPTLELAEDRPKAGELVMTVGNPKNLGWTITLGILSDLGREGFSTDGNLLQTDAAINYGNSGGPLLNMEGKVIGLNSQLLPGAQSIGFSIPTPTIRVIVEGLIQKSKE